MSKLLPWLKVRMTPFMNIKRLEREDIPDEPGVYVMISDHAEYVYPWSTANGNSPVYYIGRAQSLMERLMTHKRYCEQARSKPAYHDHYWPYYEYAAHHGCNVAWVTCEDPKTTEKAMLVDFAEYYGAKPVANGQSGWEHNSD